MWSLNELTSRAVKWDREGITASKARGRIEFQLNYLNPEMLQCCTVVISANVENIYISYRTEKMSLF